MTTQSVRAATAHAALYAIGNAARADLHDEHGSQLYTIRCTAGWVQILYEAADLIAEQQQTIAAIQAENREINRTIKKLEEIEATMSGIFGEPVKAETDEAEELL